MDIDEEDELTEMGEQVRVDLTDEGVVDLVEEYDGLSPLPEFKVGDIHKMKRQLEKMDNQSSELETPTELFGSDSQHSEDEAPGSKLMALRDEVVKRQKLVPKESSEETAVTRAISNENMKLEVEIPKMLVMPWERGFAALVLGSGAEQRRIPMLGPVMKPKRLIEVPEPGEGPEKDETEKLRLAPRSFVPLVKERKLMCAEEAEERSKVLSGWAVVIFQARNVCKAAEMLDQSGEEVLEDIFAKKKTGTLKVRLSAMTLYLRWSAAKGVLPFPLREDVAYAYVDDLRKNKAPATRAGSFRSALAFCKGTIQLEGVDAILESGRVAGSAHRSYMTKRVLKQRDALTVHQVNVLEAALVNPLTPIHDRVFAGHCLLCIYGRLRFGDSQGIECEPMLEGGYLEGGTTIHKTDSLYGRARRILPVVAPSVGVSGAKWAEEFLRARKDSGLRAMPGRPFMPAPIVGGGWSQGRVTTTEASLWLCELLRKHTRVEMDMTNIGAHSMKATALSWMAKANVSEKLRRLMGYHVKPKDKSLIIYSRDALAGGLEALTTVIGHIRRHRFRPDLNRSERWIDRREEETDAKDDGDEVLGVEMAGWGMFETEQSSEQPCIRLMETAEMTSESEDDDDEDDDSGDERNMEAVANSVIGPPKKSVEKLYRHRTTGTIHHGSSVDGKLACGRAITSMMVALIEDVHAIGSKCKVCSGYLR